MKSKRRILLLVCMAMILTVGGISAYFTDGDTATNEFIVGNVSIDLQELNWDPDNAKNISPNQIIAKDPKIVNDGESDAYVFMEVIVPYVNAVTANADGTANDAASDVELFSWTPNTGWFELSKNVDSTAGEVTYLYAYGSNTACTVLAKDVETPTLFDDVTFANIIESSAVEGVTTNIVINAYAIQTENVANGNATPSNIWDILKNQKPSTDAGTEDVKTDVKTS